MEKKEKTDAVIVGAGPAGSVTALLCARNGIKVTLIEKETLPRRKICGGGVTNKTIELLKQIDCYDETVFKHFCSSLGIHFLKNKEEFILESEKSFMGLVDRKDFDWKLSQLARNEGVEITENERFLNFINLDNGEIEVITDKRNIKAKVLVGADGALSSVSKKLGRKIEDSKRLKSMWLGIECDVSFDKLPNLTPYRCHVFFDYKKGIDYAWAFPKEKSFNVGLCGNYDFLSKTKPVDLLREFVRNVSGKDINNLKGSRPADTVIK